MKTDGLYQNRSKDGRNQWEKHTQAYWASSQKELLRKSVDVFRKEGRYQAKMRPFSTKLLESADVIGCEKQVDVICDFQKQVDVSKCMGVT